MQKQTPSAGRMIGMAVFALSCFGILLFLWVSFGGSIPLRAKKYELKVDFPEATTLAQQADVRISGVNVGKVQKKQLAPGGKLTEATLNIDQRYAPLPKDTRAILREKTLLGETFVELTPGHRSAGYLQDGSRLPKAHVEATVQLDEILRIFDPRTKQAFRRWAALGGKQFKGSAPTDLNNALGNLAGFAQDGSGLLRILDEQRIAVRQLVRNTGVVFAALNQRRGQLRQLIVNSERTFSATAAEQNALATTFQIFPTFLDESRATAVRLERFARNTQPLVNELKPVADNLGPTMHDLGALAPDLTNLFIHLKPVIRAAPRTLPAAARFLRGARPLLDSLHPFLQELNPVLSFLNYDQSIVAGFISNAAFALNYRINGQPNTHMLPQWGVIDPTKSLSLQANSVPNWARGNAYIAPNAYNRAIPLATIESFTCANVPGGIQRRPIDASNGGTELPPCFVQPKFLYDNKYFPFLKRGEVYRKPSPAQTLRGNAPVNPFTHP